jgi:hypothetical protein
MHSTQPHILLIDNLHLFYKINPFLKVFLVKSQIIAN